jgi:hypothetical protein
MTTNRQKLLDKIKALLSKTVDNGCTEAEAMTALSMAQAMIDAHEITEDEINQTKQESAIRAEMKDMRDPHHIRALLCVRISEFTNTKVWRSEYKSQKYKYNFVGLQSDVDFAMWLLETLTMFVQRELKSYIWNGGHTALEPSMKRRVINGFVHGCASRINQRLNELINQGAVNASSNGNALVVVKNELIERKMKELGIQLRDTRNRGSRVEPNAYGAGRAAGDRATFGRPVSQGGALRLK